jgi:hypothetical protein
VLSDVVVDDGNLDNAPHQTELDREELDTFVGEARPVGEAAREVLKVPKAARETLDKRAE